MTNNIFTNSIKKQTLNLVFVIDNSGSMDGSKISAVNNAIRDVMFTLPEIQEETSDVQIMVSALEFNDEATWIYNEPKTIDDFKWRDLDADGTTNLSDAYDKLSSFLSKRKDGGMMPDFGGVAPIIILMSDGEPTSNDWPDHLQSLQNKPWFKAALKYALSIQCDGENELNVLISFTGNRETVLKVYSAEALRKVIKVIAVTSSKIKSTSSSFAFLNQSSQDEAINVEIKDSLADIDDVQW